MSTLSNAWIALSCAGTLALLAPVAHGQSLCSSDDMPVPHVLTERFIHADCATCWHQPTAPVAGPHSVALDWIVPSRRGEAAPLSAAATPEAVDRLSDLKHATPATQRSVVAPVRGWPGATLRVAHGVALRGYMGASITLSWSPAAPPPVSLTVWLAMVEALPAGTEGSPVARNLVRNLFQPRWDMGQARQIQEQPSLTDLRAMNIPVGAQSARLRVIGWAQDAAGQVLLAAQSVCLPEISEP